MNAFYCRSQLQFFFTGACCQASRKPFCFCDRSKPSCSVSSSKTAQATVNFLWTRESGRVSVNFQIHRTAVFMLHQQTKAMRMTPIAEPSLIKPINQSYCPRNLKNDCNCSQSSEIGLYHKTSNCQDRRLDLRTWDSPF